MKASPFCRAACEWCRRSQHKWPTWAVEEAAPSWRSWSRPCSPCWWLSQTHRSQSGHCYSVIHFPEGAAECSNRTSAWGPLWLTPASTTAQPCQLDEGSRPACSYGNNWEKQKKRRNMTISLFKMFFNIYFIMNTNVKHFLNLSHFKTWDEQSNRKSLSGCVLCYRRLKHIY